jgi:hypothetical protein
MRRDSVRSLALIQKAGRRWRAEFFRVNEARPVRVTWTEGSWADVREITRDVLGGTEERANGASRRCPA